MTGDLVVTPIGSVLGGRTEPVDDNWGSVDAVIRIDASRFPVTSLAGLDQFSHLDVVFRFHLVEEDRINLSARHPRNNEDWPMVGIFAQRAKARPNRIGVTTCELTGVDGHDLVVRGLDAVDGTPVLDIKPHVVEFSARGEIRQPVWMTELMDGYW